MGKRCRILVVSIHTGIKDVTGGHAGRGIAWWHMSIGRPIQHAPSSGTALAVMLCTRDASDEAPWTSFPGRLEAVRKSLYHTVPTNQISSFALKLSFIP